MQVFFHSYTSFKLKRSRKYPTTTDAAEATITPKKKKENMRLRKATCLLCRPCWSEGEVAELTCVAGGQSYSDL